MFKTKPLVFISYTSDGQKTAEALKLIFDDHEIPYWDWSEKMKAGDAISSYLREIDAADFFVPIISSAYKTRPATNKELRKAVSREIRLQEARGNEFSFILPILATEINDLPLEIDYLFAVEEPIDIVSAIEKNREKIMFEDPPFLFQDWPHSFINNDGNIDAMLIIGHSGKESKPDQSEVNRIMPSLDMSIECRNQSHRISEFIPSLVKTLDVASDRVRKNKGLPLNETLGEGFGCHVDWHAIKFRQEELKNKNIISFGAGDTNLISRWILTTYHEYMPIRFDSPFGSQTLYCDSTGVLSSLEVDSVETDMHRYGALLLIVPNPLNKEKLAVVAAGLTALGTQAAILALSEATEELRAPGAYDGNFIKIIIGKENKWRACGYKILR